MSPQQPTTWETLDWEMLDLLRQRFLRAIAGEADYWQSPGQLAAYDLTFAQRIGWKWDFVLAELASRPWRPPEGTILDWGCGSGIAVRRLLAHLGAPPAASVTLWDRSRKAMTFAAGKIAEEFPATKIDLATGPSGPVGTLLVSHVLGELTPEQLQPLLEQARTASAVIWVEPGTREISRRLIEIRQQLMDTFEVVAPCTHQFPCPMLAEGNERHWCHHFAPPAPEAFTDGNWARFGRLAGIDLRSLPVSYLVLRKKTEDQDPTRTPTEKTEPSLPSQNAGSERTGALLDVRVIGRPRVYKGYALLLACGSDGLNERRLMQRRFKDAYRLLKRGDFSSFQSWRCEGIDVVEMRPQNQDSTAPQSQ